MIRTLDRYLLRGFLTNYLLSLFVLISLYVVLDLFFNFDEFTERGKPVLKVLRDIGDYYFFNLPFYFSQLSGVITLFAACGTLARLYRQNEITAVLASGTSMYRLAAPIVLAGLGMNALLVADQELLLPGIAAKLARRRDDVEGLRTYQVMCVREGERRLISALHFSPRQKRIRRFISLELSTEPATRGRVDAVVLADKAEWDPRHHGWDLSGGKRIHEAAATSGRSGGLETEGVDFYSSRLTPEDMLLRKKAQWLRFLSVRQLGEVERQGGAEAGQIAQVKHSRFTMPIFNVILLLLGMSFFMHRLPDSVLTQAAKALGVCAVALLIAFAGQQMTGSADLSPAVAPLPAWLPIFVFGPLAVVLLDSVKT